MALGVGLREKRTVVPETAGRGGATLGPLFLQFFFPVTPFSLLSFEDFNYLYVKVLYLLYFHVLLTVFSFLSSSDFFLSVLEHFYCSTFKFTTLFLCNVQSAITPIPRIYSTG